ncbi:2'-5' RNA ligase family protein [Vibrio lentus]|uniref:2'-5' RNA ligase family protein n=1 Tax=Vibrio lentus TaxID=136468 RepID=UPI000C83A542|nr:hypothetical protein [Vibrio lentus]PMJ60531.1 hypothetical protein BCU18_07465 [Vibrio lentus]PMM54060.1 hypothetical protein BCT51_12535 [Vibrio lentus]
MIQSIYDDMWQRFELALKRNEYELDPYLSDLENDTRRGITALAYLNQGNRSTVNEIIRFQKEVRELEPEQYYHPSNELHLTILSVISCLPEFALTEIDVNPYIDVFRSVLKNAGKIEIRYHGVSASPNCIVIQGFPTSDTLERLRNEFRTQLTEAGVRVTFDSRYKLVTAHSSIIRFKAPLNDDQQLLALCQRYRNHDFGHVVLENFELVFNNWYQNLDVTMSLAKYRVQ